MNRFGGYKTGTKNQVVNRALNYALEDRETALSKFKEGTQGYRDIQDEIDDIKRLQSVLNRST